MQNNTFPLIPDLIDRLQKAITGDVRFDQTTRLLYSTDASIYQIEPLGVAFPRDVDELAACVEIASSLQVPVLARGAGSSLAGQAIGPALVLDCSRHLDQQVEIHPDERTATVEPGVILASLNKAAASYGLQFGPDPASAERATLAGSLANNATGAHSILYGMAADHLLSAEVILADGSLATFDSIPLAEAHRRAGLNNLEASIYRAVLQIREHDADAIRLAWPRTWRSASGYNLNYLFPWSSSKPPQWDSGFDTPYPPIPSHTINLSSLLAGSEGTLAVIRRATIRLVPLPKYTILGVITYSSLVEACDIVPDLLELAPSAIELIPQNLIRLARSLPAYARSLEFLDQLSAHASEPPAMLVVEFAGDDSSLLRKRIKELGQRAGGLFMVADTTVAQKQVWAVRKVGLGILLSRPGDFKPIAFIEDLSVPVERLGEFLREMDRILAKHNTQGDFYAHASAGCLHVRPMVNLKSTQGVASMRAIAQDSVDLVLRLGGSVSGEHGNGLARSEWLERMFGRPVMAAFRQLKDAADPGDILNPGKILDSPPMDTNLRYGIDYMPNAWVPVMDFSKQSSLVGAVEMCNGAGVCRKTDGVMCPSFQATREEMHSTRGRANLLRAMFTGKFTVPDFRAEAILYEALGLCLACKGCKSECPSAVDMAKLKYEFLARYYRSGSGHHRPVRDYLFVYIGQISHLGSRFAPVANIMLKNMHKGGVGERFLGLAGQRRLPTFSPKSLHGLISRDRSFMRSNPSSETVLFLSDPFTEYYYPEVGLAAIRALSTAGCEVIRLPVIGAGRTFISKGFLRAAKKQAEKVVEAIQRIDPDNRLPIVGVEPSEIYTLRDEYVDFLPNDKRVSAIADRAYMIDEFLVRPGRDRQERIMRIADQFPLSNSPSQRVLLHGHCYQKAQPPASDGYPSGVAATIAMLSRVGYSVSMIEAGCCGMAGAFGYEAEHYTLSMQVGGMTLFPALLNANEDVIIATAGVSCQSQIEDGTGRKPVHPISLLVFER